MSGVPLAVCCGEVSCALDSEELDPGELMTGCLP
jgi:hypothetical protein